MEIKRNYQSVVSYMRHQVDCYQFLADYAQEDNRPGDYMKYLAKAKTISQLLMEIEILSKED